MLLTDRDSYCFWFLPMRPCLSRSLSTLNQLDIYGESSRMVRTAASYLFASEVYGILWRQPVPHHTRSSSLIIESFSISGISVILDRH